MIPPALSLLLCFLLVEPHAPFQATSSKPAMRVAPPQDPKPKPPCKPKPPKPKPPVGVSPPVARKPISPALPPVHPATVMVSHASKPVNSSKTGSQQRYESIALSADGVGDSLALLAARSLAKDDAENKLNLQCGAYGGEVGALTVAVVETDRCLADAASPFACTAHANAMCRRPVR